MSGDKELALYTSIGDVFEYLDPVWPVLEHEQDISLGEFTDSQWQRLQQRLDAEWRESVAAAMQAADPEHREWSVTFIDEGDRWPDWYEQPEFFDQLQPELPDFETADICAEVRAARPVFLISPGGAVQLAPGSPASGMWGARVRQWRFSNVRGRWTAQPADRDGRVMHPDLPGVDITEVVNRDPWERVEGRPCLAERLTDIWEAQHGEATA